MEIKKNERCRMCDHELEMVFDFGTMVLVNSLKNTEDEARKALKYDLCLKFCKKCYLGQLTNVIPPEVLYKDYVYQSSVSQNFKNHCRELADTLSNKRDLVVIDIAGNDGALANEILQKNSLAKMFVFDVAQNDEPAKYTKIKKFWNKETAVDFVQQYGKADIITAQNVIGHVDGIVDFFHAVYFALKDEGEVIVEIPSFIELIKEKAFETIYHEHVSYWTETAMKRLAFFTNFELVKTELLPIHCGSFRFRLRKGRQENLFVPEETDFFKENPVENFKENVMKRLILLSDLTEDVPNYNIVAISASAKSIILLNVLHFDFIDYHLEDTPLKIGKFVPGTGKEIKPFSRENLEHADIALIVSRNITIPLIERLNHFGFKGVIVAV